VVTFLFLAGSFKRGAEAMSLPWLIPFIVLCIMVLAVAFLLLGTLRSLGLVSWRLEQLEATMPRRLGRDGLRPGKKAPEFTLPGVEGRDISLHDFSGRRVLLVFTQSGCSPCQKIIPELNRLGPDEQVLVVNNGDVQATRKWSTKVGARFPVLAQAQFSISKKYQVFATPFAFLIDAKGVIVSKGIINNRQHIHYVLSGACAPENHRPRQSEESASERGESAESLDSVLVKEVHHVHR
jgi:methylamine dehydrogenase accessory protein MauD